MYDIELVNHTKDILVRRKETLSIAESVTSGHLQAAFSLAQMATGFFQGGATTYNLTQKTRVLHIDPVHALSCNCVSDKVAGEMAMGVANLFKTDWALAITGYAVPVPELGVNELFAHWAVVHRGKVGKVEMIKAQKNGALSVQVFYTNEVLKGFLGILRVY